MRPALPHFDESQCFQARYHFLRLQHWQLRHGQAISTF
jgi:hypothetical protein